MGCGCGGKKRDREPTPVAEDAPDPNQKAKDSEAWWQANPPLPPTAAVPMPQ